MKPPVSLSVLKQRAKQIKKEKSIAQHEALNEAAREYGFSNYKHYLNVLEEFQMQAEASQRVGQQMIASQKRGEIFKRVESLIPILQSLKVPFAEFVNGVTKDDHSDESLQSICEQKSDLKKYLELHLLRDFLVDESGDIDFEAPYHLAKEVSLKNLVFKLNDPVPMHGDLDQDYLCIEGDYDATLEFAFEHDRDDKDNPDLLKDRQMWGSFELTIDKKANINIENMDIGWNAW